MNSNTMVFYFYLMSALLFYATFKNLVHIYAEKNSLDFFPSFLIHVYICSSSMHYLRKAKGLGRPHYHILLTPDHQETAEANTPISKSEQCKS